MKPEPDKLFNWRTILLVPLGIALNILLAQLAILFGLPIFLDSVGTVVAAAVGGLLPGIMVGFFSNAINSIGDPITLYYSVISVLIAMLAYGFSRKRMYTRFATALLTALPLAFVGGVLGSLLTWALSGLNLGSGVSSTYALALIGQFRLSPFAAQLIADTGIDIVDKLVTVALAFAAIKCMPDALLKRFPHGDIYLPVELAQDAEPSPKE